MAEDDSENDIQYWLKESENHARRIENEEERNWALSYLAEAYAIVGQFSKAYQIADQLPLEHQGRCLAGIIMKQTFHNDPTGALKRIQNIREPKIKSRCLYTLAYMCAKNNVPISLKIAEQLSEPSKSSILKKIAGRYVLNGEINKAEHIVQQISDPNQKNEAQHWITAANISNAEDIAKAIAQTNPYPSDLNFRLREIARTKLKSGQIKKAKQIIESLPDSHNTIIGYCDLAEYYLTKDDKENFNRYIEKAKKETKQYFDPDMPEFVSFYQALLYMRIAKLQIDAGDIEAGFATAKISLKKGQKAYKPFGSSLFEGLGSKNTVYGLMIQAGKIEEVREMAQREDGSFPREVAILLIGAYTRAGHDDKAKAILDSLSTSQDKFHLSLAIIEGMNQRKAKHK